MFLGIQQGKIKFYTEESLDKTLYNLDEVVETQVVKKQRPQLESIDDDNMFPF